MAVTEHCCLLVDRYQHFTGTRFLSLQRRKSSTVKEEAASSSFSTLKMEVSGSIETLVPIQQRVTSRETATLEHLYSENGGSRFFQNFGTCALKYTKYTASHASFGKFLEQVTMYVPVYFSLCQCIHLNKYAFDRQLFPDCFFSIVVPWKGRGTDIFYV